MNMARQKKFLLLAVASWLIAIIACLLFVDAVRAAERTVDFVWSYTAEEQVNIDGFRIYRDCGSPECVVLDNIPATARTATLTFEDNKKSSTFSSVAYAVAEDGEELESAQSDYAVWVLPKHKPPKVASFSLQ